MVSEAGQEGTIEPIFAQDQLPPTLGNRALGAPQIDYPAP